MSAIVVIGAGQAGATLVETLRSKGFEGPITLIGAEALPPYQRPPLSKKYLLGEMTVDRLLLRPASFYADQNIDLALGTAVRSIDPKARRVHLASGDSIAYDQLALTTGSVPRRLPAAMGGDLNGVFTVRDLEDVDAMAPRFQPGARVLIVGGGYIGLEAAAVAAARGLHVTLVEMADRILQRVASPQTSDYFRDLHRQHGVTLREGVGLGKLTAADGAVTGAVLNDGSRLEVDFVIVGVGIAPATDLAAAAGLVLDNGIAVDGRGQTSDPHIFAAGDCCSFPHAGGRIRLESVPNAIDQAQVVAQAMLGGTDTYTARPWFWSDQYDVKLQIAGLNTGYDRCVTRPGARPGAQSVWYFGADRLLAVDAMNDARAYMTGKRWIEAGVSPDADALAAADDLKTLAVS